jgi:hypothetical protein
LKVELLFPHALVGKLWRRHFLFNSVIHQTAIIMKLQWRMGSEQPLTWFLGCFPWILTAHTRPLFVPRTCMAWEHIHQKQGRVFWWLDAHWWNNHSELQTGADRRSTSVVAEGHLLDAVREKSHFRGHESKWRKYHTL